MRASALTGTIVILTAVLCRPRLCAEAEPGKQFSISGVVLSTRDGSPVPYCRLTAATVPAGSAGSGDREAGRRSGEMNFSGEGERGGPAGFPGGGGRQGGAGPRSRQDTAGESDNDVTADAQGRFTLNLPHAGAWRVSGTARGFRTQSYEEHEGFYARVVLSDALPSYSLSFHMVPDSLITGLVLDEAGEPVRQARVAAERIAAVAPGQVAPRVRALGNAVTDDRGRYEIGGLAPGLYRVRLQAQPWYAAGGRTGFGTPRAAAPQADLGASLDPSLDVVYPTTWFPGVEREEAAETIAFSGGEAREADFHLNAIPAIHLQLAQTEQAPATQVGRPPLQRVAMITKVTADGSVTNVSPAGISAAGTWDFGGLTPGIYEFRLPGTDGQQNADVRQIEVPPDARGVITLENARPLTRVSVRVEGVDDGSFPLVEFVDLETGRRITASEGRDGRGGRGSRGAAEDSSGDTTLDQGTPLLTAMLPPHRYAVSMLGNGAAYLTGMKATDARVTGFTVEIGTGTPTLTLEVASGRAELSGVVREGVQPVAGTMVLLVPAMLGQPGNVSVVSRAESATDGSFTFRSVIPGQYIAVAIDKGWATQWTVPEVLATYLAHGVPVELKPGAKLTETLDAVLP